MKIAYIVSEKGCMDPTTGAFQHIRMGIRELRQYASVKEYLPALQPVRAQTKPPKNSDARSYVGSRAIKESGMWGALRDLRDYLRSVSFGWKISRTVKRDGCDIAYVRVDQLQTVSFFLRLRGIKVFLEVNGLLFRARQSSYRSWLSFLYERLERRMLSRAHYVFFVGSYGQYWKLPNQNWMEVENGIEKTFRVSSPQVREHGSPLNLVLLARLMPHHRGELLVEALAGLDATTRQSIVVHLAGTGFDELRKELDQICKTVDHGFVQRSGVGQLLESMHIGLIVDCPPYGSQMKLFDYSAAGCVVLAPDVPHLVSFYQGQGIRFFSRGSSADLSSAILNISRNQIDANQDAQRFQTHILTNYTWDAVFARKWQAIKSVIDRATLRP